MSTQQFKPPSFSIKEEFAKFLSYVKDGTADDRDSIITSKLNIAQAQSRHYDCTKDVAHYTALMEKAKERLAAKGVDVSTL